MRTWVDYDENSPGFVEIDLVGHEGGNSRGEFCFTLTVHDLTATTHPGSAALRRDAVACPLTIHFRTRVEESINNHGSSHQ